MKTLNNKRELHVNGGDNAAEITISANAKAFKALMSGLYANKAQSITREIWSNAYDAHAAAGCPERPFEVTVPSILDPVFRVRDFGVSMSHEHVMNVYRRLFESTKEETNTQIGKFGLGSKSPFSYTDSFNIISYLDGTKTVYMTYYNESGIPVIDCIGTFDTDEDNGIEISFPVRMEDVAAFAKAADIVSLGFDVKPVVTGSTEHVWPDVTVLEKGASWKMYRSGMLSGPVARQGCVLYPIDMNVIRNKEASKATNFVANQNIIIDFPVGSLEITVSRESLSYGDREPTIESIKIACEKVFKEISNRVDSMFSDTNTEIENIAKANYMRSVFSNAYSYFPVIARIPQTYRISGHMLSVKGCILDKRTLDYRSRIPEWNNVIDTRPGDKSVGVVFIDRENYNKGNICARIREASKEFFEKGKSKILVVYNTSEEVKRSSISHAHAFAEVMDSLDVVDISEYPAEKKPRKNHVATKYYEFYGSFTPSRVPMNQSMFDNGGIYVPIVRGTNEAYIHLKAADVFYDRGATVIGITKAKMKAFENSPQWKHVDDAIKEWITSFDVAYLARHEEVEYYEGMVNYRNNRKLGELPKTKLFAEIHKFIAEADKIADTSSFDRKKYSSKEISFYKTYCLNFKRERDIDTRIPEIKHNIEKANELYTNLCGAYPLMPIAMEKYVDWAIIQEYIDAVDYMRSEKRRAA